MIGILQRRMKQEKVKKPVIDESNRKSSVLI